MRVTFAETSLVAVDVDVPVFRGHSTNALWGYYCLVNWKAKGGLLECDLESSRTALLSHNGIDP